MEQAILHLSTVVGELVTELVIFLHKATARTVVLSAGALSLLPDVWVLFLPLALDA